MPYYLHHNCIFQSKEVENMVIELYRKDVVRDAVTEIRADTFSVAYLNGEGNKLDGIIACEATLGIWLPYGSPLDYQDFIITFHDEWKIIAYSDSQVVFTGFLNPSEGRCQFKDKPYSLTLSATDGIAFLKQEPLSTFELDEYTGTHTIIEYITNIISKTGIELPIDVRANIYESSMISRDIDPTKDFLAQTKVHYRSFLKDPTTFMSCYDVLEMICRQHLSFYQWNGRWVFNRFAEMQDSVGPVNWRTEYRPYDPMPVTTGVKEIETYNEVGRYRKQHPVNANAEIASMFPLKSAKHLFPYNVWPEIPANNKFERGTVITPLSGPGYTAYSTDEWTYYSAIDNTLTLTPDIAFRKSTFDAYNIETIREIVLQRNPSAPNSDYRWLRAQPFGVNKGDVLEVNIEFKSDVPTAGLGTPAVVIYIEGNSGSRYSLDWQDTFSAGQWLSYSSVFLTGLAPIWGKSMSATEYNHINFRSLPILEDGTLYVVLVNARQGATNMFAGFSLAYIPFTAGGFMEVTGDSWTTSNNHNYKDILDEEVGLSDSLKKVFKGALYREDGITLTTPTWRRPGHPEDVRHYKELINLGVYNHLFRSQWKISGTFGGTKFSPVSDPTLFEPLSFHRHHTFPDAPELAGVMFMIVPPLTIDYKEGKFDGTFVDCLNSNNYDEAAPTKESVMQGIISLVAQTTEAEWNSAGGAPPSGTTMYPPVAHTGFLGNDDLSFWVPLTANPTFIADANGAGNSPSFTLISQSAGTFKWYLTEIGTDVAVGNRFIIDIFGMQLIYTVEANRLYHDGNQTGDLHFFNYKFK